MGGTQQVRNLLPLCLILSWVRSLSGLWLNFPLAVFRFAWWSIFPPLTTLYKLALSAPFLLSCFRVTDLRTYIFLCIDSLSHTKVTLFYLMLYLSTDQCLARSSEWVNWWMNQLRKFRGRRRVLGLFFLLNMVLWAHLTSRAVRLYFKLLPL